MPKPRLNTIHWGISAAWLVLYLGFAIWLADQLSGPCDGCVFEGVPFYVWFLFFFLPAAAFQGLVTLSARFLATGTLTRIGIMVVLPLLLVIWFISSVEWI